MNQSTQRIIRNKIGLLNLAEELGNVSKAYQMMGVSRDTFYRYRSARDDGGVEALLEKPRRKPNPKNRVEPQIEQAVLDFALEYPAHGQVRVSNELRRRCPQRLAAPHAAKPQASAEGTGRQSRKGRHRAHRGPGRCDGASAFH